MKKLLTNQLQVDAPFTYVTNLEQVGENTYYGTSFFGDLAVNGHTAACLCFALYVDLSGATAFSFGACLCDTIPAIMGIEIKNGRNLYMERPNITKETTETLLETKFLIVVVQEAGQEARLLLTYEFRYPTGQLLLSPPTGLIDPQDKEKVQPLLETAAREIHEETGLTVRESDSLRVIKPCLFSSPGMTEWNQ